MFIIRFNTIYDRLLENKLKKGYIIEIEKVQ